MTAIWDRLRKIADDAERASKQALEEEAAKRLSEYREARHDDPLDVLVRVPKPTAWQHEALKLIASGVPDALGRESPWTEFMDRTKPDRSRIDPESRELAEYVRGHVGEGLNTLGLAVLAHLEDEA